MKVMKKYGVVEFYDKKGFELSRTFATVLASCSTQHPNLLISIMYAVKSYADEASDNEKTLICTHLAMHVIPHDKRVEVVRKDHSLSETRQALKQNNTEFKPPIF